MNMPKQKVNQRLATLIGVARKAAEHLGDDPEKITDIDIRPYSNADPAVSILLSDYNLWVDITTRLNGRVTRRIGKVKGDNRWIADSNIRIGNWTVELSYVGDEPETA